MRAIKKRFQNPAGDGIVTRVPTIFIENGFRFFFYSNEGHEPCHVHVVGRGGETKVWIPSGEMAFIYRLNAKDLKEVQKIVLKRSQEIEERWHAFFKSGT